MFADLAAQRLGQRTRLHTPFHRRIMRAKLLDVAHSLQLMISVTRQQTFRACPDAVIRVMRPPSLNSIDEQPLGPIRLVVVRRAPKAAFISSLNLAWIKVLQAIQSHRIPRLGVSNILEFIAVCSDAVEEMTFPNASNSCHVCSDKRQIFGCGSNRHNCY